MHETGDCVNFNCCTRKLVEARTCMCSLISTSAADENVTKCECCVLNNDFWLILAQFRFSFSKKVIICSLSYCCVWLGRPGEGWPKGGPRLLKAYVQIE